MSALPGVFGKSAVPVLGAARCGHVLQDEARREGELSHFGTATVHPKLARPRT